MKKRHIGFWIAFPIGALLLLAIILFLFDLLNGPLFLFILALVAWVGLVISSVLLLSKRIPFRLIPWGAFIASMALLIPFSTPSVEPRSATLFPNPEKTEVLHLANGAVQGAYTKDKAVEVYAGIPYAKPPVGELRWKETEPVEDWEGVRDCTFFAPKSMQQRANPLTDTLVDIYAEQSWHPDYQMYPVEPTSEDSLYLNIWRPASFSGSLPILVYIHGGSLTHGSSAKADYNGETMARNGVIMITIAYRLGVFGYFAHPDLIEESPNDTTGNYGLLDQIEALRWIQNNADYFGGDKTKVTIAGESAGSSAVSALCASPLAAGLFKRAIGESSSVVSAIPPHTFRSLDKALEVGQEVMEEFKCHSIDELRNVPAEKLVNTQSTNSSMTVDGYALPRTPHEIYEDGLNNEEALLNGYNVKEADAFVVPTFLFDPTNSKNIRERLVSYFDEEAAEALMAAYADEISKDAFTAFNSIISAYWFMQPHVDWSKMSLASGSDVYRYQFTKENGYYGTYHSGEMIYCYGNLDKSSQQFAYDASDWELSSKMVSYWANFVKTGDPNGEGLPSWPKWTGENDPLMELNVEPKPIEETAKKAYPILDAWKLREAAKEGESA